MSTLDLLNTRSLISAYWLSVRNGRTELASRVLEKIESRALYSPRITMCTWAYTISTTAGRYVGEFQAY